MTVYEKNHPLAVTPTIKSTLLTCIHFQNFCKLSKLCQMALKTHTDTKKIQYTQTAEISFVQVCSLLDEIITKIKVKCVVWRFLTALVQQRQEIIFSISFAVNFILCAARHISAFEVFGKTRQK